MSNRDDIKAISDDYDPLLMSDKFDLFDPEQVAASQRAIMAMGWTRWQMRDALREATGFTPLLASWNSKSDPAMIRLTAYLDEIAGALDAPSLAGSDWGLDLVVDVGVEARLLRDYDLENYLTPLVNRMGAGHFRFARARKRVGGGSRLVLGKTISDEGQLLRDWRFFTVAAGSGAQGKAWKEGIRLALFRSGPEILPSGPVQVHMAWQGSATRNWVGLWKPTGDAMGPVLGAPDPTRPFHVNDDRWGGPFLRAAIREVAGSTSAPFGPDLNSEAGLRIKRLVRWRPT
jgi:hypothetical protein